METKIRISYYIIIFSLITINSSFVLSQNPTNTSVLDVDGNQLQTNTKYYIFSPNQGGGLGLSIRDRRLPCPPNVVQENDKSLMGISLKFFTVNNKQLHINMHTDLNIVFMGATICVQSTVWRVGKPDPFTGRRYVRSGGVLGRPGVETVENWFKIERFGQGYKIVYCPTSVCRSCRVECGEVGLYVENGNRWLGLGGQLFVIAFKKLA